MKTKYPYIVKTPGTCLGKPRIDGRRVTVEKIVLGIERFGMSPDEIAQEYDLTLAQIHSALTYYFDHVKEIKKEIEKGDKIIDQFEKSQPSLIEKLQAKIGRIKKSA